MKLGSSNMNIQSKFDIGAVITTINRPAEEIKQLFQAQQIPRHLLSSLAMQNLSLIGVK
jgi:hypothetical protein